MAKCRELKHNDKRRHSDHSPNRIWEGVANRKGVKPTLILFHHNYHQLVISCRSSTILPCLVCVCS